MYWREGIIGWWNSEQESSNKKDYNFNKQENNNTSKWNNNEINNSSTNKETPQGATNGWNSIDNKWGEKEINEDSINIEKIKKKLQINNPNQIDPENFMRNFDFLTSKEDLTVFYNLVQNDASLKIFIREKLSWNNKVKILKTICNNVDYFSNSNSDFFDRKYRFKKEFFKQQDDNEWIKDQISSGGNKESKREKKSEKERLSIIRDIEEYFLVLEIIRDWFNYKQDQDKILGNKRIENQVEAEYKENQNLFVWAESSINTKIGRSFLLRMFDVWEQMDDLSKQFNSIENKNYQVQEENDKEIIWNKKLNIMRNYAKENWCMIWLVKSLSYLDENAKRNFIELSDEWLIVFLEKVIKDPEISWKIKDIMAYEVDDKVANRVAQLLVSQTAIDRIFTETIVAVKDKKWFQNSKINQEAQSRAKIKIGKQLFIEEQLSKRQELFANLDKDILLDKERENLPVTKQQEYQASSIQSKEFEKEYGIQLRKTMEENVLQSQTNSTELTTLQKNLLIEKWAHSYSTQIGSKYLSPEEQIIFNKKIDDIEKRNQQELFLAAQKYWFTEDLHKVRWSDYYAQVEQNYIQQQTQVLEKYQEGKTGKDLRKIWQKLSGQKEFVDFFDKNKINRNDLQWSLTGEEYTNILLKEKWEIKNKYKEKFQQQQESVLLDTANTKIKDRFVERVTYFLWNVLDIQIDKDGKENILKWLNIDEKNIDKNIITIQGKYQNKKLTFTYNIQTGELFTGKWLHGEKDSPKTIIGQKMEKLNTVSWPTFWEHFTQAKRISYTDILQKSEGNEINFEKNITDQLAIKCPLPEQSDSFKEEMKLHNLKNIVAQEMFEMMWLENKQWSISWVDGSQYHMFPLLARSFDMYTKDQLLQTRSIIQWMTDFYRNQKQVDGITSEKASIDPKLHELEKDTKDNRYKPLKNITKKLFTTKEHEWSNPNYMGDQFNKFFTAFLSDNQQSNDGQKILDPEKLYTYYEDLQQTENKSINKEYFANLQENMSQYFAETDLDKNLQIA